MNDKNNDVIKGKIRLIFYLISLGIFFNVFWLSYSLTGPLMRYVGIKNTTLVRDFVGPYGYIIILLALLFTLFYFFITHKKFMLLSSLSSQELFSSLLYH